MQSYYAEKVSRIRIAARFVNVPPCLIGIEAGMASHHIARELTALGHEVKQVPPSNRVEAFGLFGFSSTAIAVTPGTSSRSSSSRFATNSAEQRCQLPFQEFGRKKKVPTSIREGGILKNVFGIMTPLERGVSPHFRKNRALAGPSPVMRL